MDRLDLYDAAGNRFVLLDARLAGPPADPAGLARRWCAPNALRAGWRADGLLLLLRGGEHADARMVVHNADGSRAEACGNGLRAVAWHLARGEGRNDARVATDGGVRRTELRVAEDAEAALLAVELGPATVRSLSARLPAPWDALPAARVEVGNPHCVVLVPDGGAVDLARLARAVSTSADFPRGVNVGALARRLGEWRLRVHERGAGETRACGTGAGAAAAALASWGRDHPPLDLVLPGGRLRIEGAPDEGLVLEGPVRHLGAASSSAFGAPVAASVVHPTGR